MGLVWDAGSWRERGAFDDDMICALINDGASGGGIDDSSSLVSLECSTIEMELRNAIH